MRFLTIATVALALIAGAYLRFADLGAREISADEGASWAASAAPSAIEVLHRQARLNPGKLGVHDVALHYWMIEFGDSAVAMRCLSATAGTIAIILVFFLTRELLQSACAFGYARESLDGLSTRDRDIVAAIAALLFAVNLITIKYAREARMYPLVLVFTIAQVWFLLRAAQHGGLANYLAIAVFTGLGVATNLTAIVVLVPEGIWIALMLLRRGDRRFVLALKLTVSIVSGLAMIAPLAIIYLRVRTGPTNPQAYAWIPMPPPYAPFALFNKATGSFAFPIMAALALWGAMSGWKRARGAVVFALLWMLAPPIAALTFSYVIQPAFLERYLISCFVPFFILDALGVWQLRYRWAQVGALAIVVALALGHVVSYDRKPHDAQWREAAIIATCNVPMDGAVVVAPGYAVNVVRYYLRRAPAVVAVPVEEPDDARVAIVAEEGVTPARLAQLGHDYEHLLVRLRGVTVRQK